MKRAHVPKKMVIALGAESPTLEELRSSPSKATDDEGEVNVACKLSERKDLRMRNHVDVRNNNKGRLEKD